MLERLLGPERAPKKIQLFPTKSVCILKTFAQFIYLFPPKAGSVEKDRFNGGLFSEAG